MSERATKGLEKLRTQTLMCVPKKKKEKQFHPVEFAFYVKNMSCDEDIKLCELFDIEAHHRGYKVKGPAIYIRRQLPKTGYKVKMYYREKNSKCKYSAIVFRPKPDYADRIVLKFYLYAIRERIGDIRRIYHENYKNHTHILIKDIENREVPLLDKEQLEEAKKTFALQKKLAQFMETYVRPMYKKAIADIDDIIDEMIGGV